MSTFLGTETGTQWERWARSSHNAAVDGDSLVVARERHPTYASPTLVFRPSDGVDYLDLAFDGCGTTTLLASDGTLWTLPPGGVDARPVPFLDGEDRWVDATSVCVTDDTVYVTDAAEGRVFAIARTIRQTRWVSATEFVTPVRVVAGRDAVYVLDAGTADGGTVFELDADGRATAVVSGLTDPVDLAVDADATLYALDREADETSVVRAFEAPTVSDDPDSDGGTPDGETDSDDTNGGGDDSGESDANGDVPALRTESEGRRRTVAAPLTCLAATPDGNLVAGVGAGTNDRTLYAASPDGTFERLTTFKRPVSRLVVRTETTREAGGESTRPVGLYALDEEDSALHRLEVTRATRLNATTSRYDALATHRFDAGEADVRWHRVTTSSTTDGEGTHVRLHYYATNSERARPVHGSSEWERVVGSDPSDVLLSEAVGRYLWVGLELGGSAFSSPSVESLRAYFPRDSYLRYLPAVYREDPASAEFLERFLSLFESAFDDIEAEFDLLPRYLDAAGAPPEFLGWLERWLAAETGPAWPEEARRTYLGSVPALYRARGTRVGLVSTLDLYLAEAAPATPSLAAAQERELARVDEAVAEGTLLPSDAERAKRRVRSHVTVLEFRDVEDCPDSEGREAFEAFFGCPRCYFVFVRPHVSEEVVAEVEVIVAESQPAHAVGRVVRLQPWVQLGGHSYLGVNSTLPSRDLVVGRSTLSRDAVLGDREAHAQLGVRSRLNEDSLIS